MNSIFSGISVKKKARRPVDPIEIFQAATVSDDSINDLWLAQGDALREWHNHRNCGDISVVLNTGAGKTLVGLLIAQSLVNESTRHVAYACASIQLVEQTAEKARGYGLAATTYYRGDFSDHRYHRCDSPCITTYQALFNGLTRFRSDDLAAVVFDDAHTAEHILRDQFSLRIDRTTMEPVYRDIVELFREYYRSIGREGIYDEVTGKRSSEILWIPPFAVHRNAAEFTRILLDAPLAEQNVTKFAWQHIRDHEDVCCLLISENAATLTPPTIPLSTLPYFDSDVRRVYLSATLAAPDAFVRTFGRQPERLVAPSTTAGECERLILFPSILDETEDDVDSSIRLLRDRKALILVPTYSRSAKWSSIAEPPPRDEVAETVMQFRDAAPNSDRKLILAARYDGVDLPGDTCRMLVIDDLPKGSGPLERFQWDNLTLSNSLRSTIASRIVQSFGRISRGMSDHGVVLLTGRELRRWLLVPRNLSLLPSFLQKQIALGREVSEKIVSDDDLTAATDGCLQRDTIWTKMYSNWMQEAPSENDVGHSEGVVDLALAESAYVEAMWNRDFERAARVLTRILDLASGVSDNSNAWLSVWLGYALDRAGDTGLAALHYAHAHAIQRNIPPASRSEETPGIATSEQIISVERQIDCTSRTAIKLPKHLSRNLAPLGVVTLCQGPRKLCGFWASIWALTPRGLKRNSVLAQTSCG